jgi:hypothetical protein
MTPRHQWRSYGTDPLPTAPEALGEPLRAFPSWFLRIECDRCGKVRMLNDQRARHSGTTVCGQALRAGARLSAGVKAK